MIPFSLLYFEKPKIRCKILKLSNRPAKRKFLLSSSDDGEFLGKSKLSLSVIKVSELTCLMVALKALLSPFTVLNMLLISDLSQETHPG